MKRSNVNARVSVRKIESGSRTSWEVGGYDFDGKRIRKRFDTPEKAEGYRQLCISKMERETIHELRRTRLNDLQIADAERASALLGNGQSLFQAVTFFKAHYKAVKTDCDLREAIAEFVQEKQRQGRRPHTIQNLRTRCGMLARAFKGKRVREIRREDLENLIHRKGASPATRNNDRRIYRQFFGWSLVKGYCAENPAAHIEAVSVENGEPATLDLEAVKALLRAARDFKGGKMLAVYVVQIFCGLRPAEAQGLTWERISLEEGHLTVSGQTSKRRKRRLVEIPPAGLAWLKACPVKNGALEQRNFRKDLAKVRELAGFRPERLPKDPERRKALEGRQPWVKDLMRHTSISMRIAQSQDENATALWAGTSPAMIHEHYRGLVTKRAAGAFWKLRPANIGKATKSKGGKSR